MVEIVNPDGRITADRLLVDPASPPFDVAVPWHEVTVGAEGIAAFLRLRWRRRGLLRQLAGLGRIGRRLLRR